MTNATVDTYSFIEFEGVEPMHQNVETIVGDTALIARIKKVDKDSNWIAKHSGGMRAYLTSFDGVDEISLS